MKFDIYERYRRNRLSRSLYRAILAVVLTVSCTLVLLASEKSPGKAPPAVQVGIKDVTIEPVEDPRLWLAFVQYV